MSSILLHHARTSHTSLTHTLTHEYLSITTSLPHYITALSDCDTDPQQSRSSPVELCVSSAAVHRRPASRQPCHRYPHSLTHSLTHYSLTHSLTSCRRCQQSPRLRLRTSLARAALPRPLAPQRRRAHPLSLPLIVQCTRARVRTTLTHTLTHTLTQTLRQAVPPPLAKLSLSPKTLLSLPRRTVRS